MSRGKNGCGIIFNFEEFHDPRKRREGSEEDVRKLKDAFQAMNVDLGDRIHKNLTCNSMRERLKDCK